jgi:hypothetical protein
MKLPNTEAPCALQELASALTLNGHNGGGTCEPLTPTSPPSNKPACTRAQGSKQQALSPSPHHPEDDDICESSSIRRRGQQGQAVGLSEDGAPSPTRIQRRSPARASAVFLAKELCLQQPLCDPRIAALRASMDANVENEAPDSRMRSRTTERTNPIPCHRDAPRNRLSSPLKGYSFVLAGEGGTSVLGSLKGAAMDVE